jgi:glc operon protein GlcG
MALSLKDAERIADAAIRKAEALQITVTVAVCDAGGRLITLKRMDGAIWASVLGCQGKAMASAAFNRPSGELQERADNPTIRGIIAAEGGHIIPGRGAVPITGRDGELEGACGVGGGTAEQDEECARAGVAARSR